MSIEVSIKNPTTIRAGAVAKDGIARKIGDRNRDSANRIAATTAVKPVLPPSATPDALSTKVVVVEVPRTAPTADTLLSRSVHIRGEDAAIMPNPFWF